MPDIQQFLNSFKLPGVDLKSIVDGGRVDIRGVALANRRAYEGMQSLAQRQAEMLREAAADWQLAVKGLAALDADELPAQRTALARRVIRQALANVRVLAEASARLQAEACAAAGARARPPSRLERSIAAPMTARAAHPSRAPTRTMHGDEDEG